MTKLARALVCKVITARDARNST